MPQGTLDSTFGNGGYANVNGVCAPGLGAVTADANSRLHVLCANGVARLDSTGALDTSWGSNGFAPYDTSQVNTSYGAIVQDSAGRLLVSGLYVDNVGSGIHPLLIRIWQ